MTKRQTQSTNLGDNVEDRTITGSTKPPDSGEGSGGLTLPENIIYWQEYANCRNYAGDWYSTSKNEMRICKRICHECSVRLKCLVYSLEKREEYGIWGGLDAKERRRAIRRQRTAYRDAKFGRYTKLRTDR